MGAEGMGAEGMGVVTVAVLKVEVARAVATAAAETAAEATAAGMGAEGMGAEGMGVVMVAVVKVEVARAVAATARRSRRRCEPQPGLECGSARAVKLLRTSPGCCNSRMRRARPLRERLYMGCGVPRRFEGRSPCSQCWHCSMKTRSPGHHHRRHRPRRIRTSPCR